MSQVDQTPEARYTDEHGFTHDDDSYGRCVRCRIWAEGTDDDEVMLAEMWPCPTVRLHRAAADLALAAALRHDHKDCTPLECRYYSEYGFSWEGARATRIYPCPVAAIIQAAKEAERE